MGGRSHPWSRFSDGFLRRISMASLILRFIQWSSFPIILTLAQSISCPVSRQCSFIAEAVVFLWKWTGPMLK